VLLVEGERGLRWGRVHRALPCGGVKGRPGCSRSFVTECLIVNFNREANLAYFAEGFAVARTNCRSRPGAGKRDRSQSIKINRHRFQVRRSTFPSINPIDRRLSSGIALTPRRPT
jgi:hypothetical protein